MKRWNKNGKSGCAIYLIIAGCIVGVSFSALLITSVETQYLLTKEDGFFESLGSIGWLIASIVFFVVFWKDLSRDNLNFLKTKRNLVFCLLGIFCFIACGEEISWGQRIFKLQTPELLLKINRQGETNFHNITFLQDLVADSGDLPFWAKMLSMTKVFQAFWFGYCVLLPIMSKFSQRTCYYLKKINVPLIPIGLSSVFFANYLISRVLPFVFNAGNYSNDHYFVEIKECNFGLLFMLISIYFFQNIVGGDTADKHATESLYDFKERLILAKTQLSDGVATSNTFYNTQKSRSLSKA